MKVVFIIQLFTGYFVYTVFPSSNQNRSCI